MNFFQLLIADKERRDAERMRTIRVTCTEAGMDDFVLDISPLTPIIQLKRELNQVNIMLVINNVTELIDGRMLTDYDIYEDTCITIVKL